MCRWNKLSETNELKTRKLSSFVFVVLALILMAIFVARTLRPPATPMDIIYLPEKLLAVNPVDPSQALESFLSNRSNRKVIFPSGKTFVLERQLVIYNVNNLEIDFNGCTIQLPDNCVWKARWDTGEYVPISAITVHNSNNITFRNYIIDGNSENISSDQWCIGLWLSNTTGFSSYEGTYKYCNYHQIVIYPGTKNVYFAQTYFKDHGGASIPAGISDVYVSNAPDDNFTFINTTVDNTELRERQGQCFYITGYNGVIDNLNANNCSIPLDVRKGKHVAKNFYITNAELMLIVQPNPINSTEFANLTASYFTGINIKGKYNGGAAGVYIVGCEKCHLDNFTIGMDYSAKYSWYGIRIKKFNDEYPLNNIEISNTIVTNAKVSEHLVEKSGDSVTIKGITSIASPPWH